MIPFFGALEWREGAGRWNKKNQQPVERGLRSGSHREMLRGAVVGSDGADLRRRQVRGPSGAAGRSILAAKFGTKFVSAASILRSGCGINAKVRTAGDPPTPAGWLTSQSFGRFI